MLSHPSLDHTHFIFNTKPTILSDHNSNFAFDILYSLLLTLAGGKTSSGKLTKF